MAEWGIQQIPSKKRSNKTEKLSKTNFGTLEIDSRIATN
jgi:hypothetical protein